MARMAALAHALFARLPLEQMLYCTNEVSLIAGQKKINWTLCRGAAIKTTLGRNQAPKNRRKHMKTWTKPAVREQEVGLEVTSYLPAEIDVI